MNATQAPDFPARENQRRGYPSGSRRLGPAWSEAWDVLEGASEPMDGRELATLVAPRHGLAPATLVALLSRAATAGLLDRELRPVKTGRGIRQRTFYRIRLTDHGRG